MKQTLPQEISSFLQEQHIMTVATVADGKPSAATVYFYFEEDGDFYFPTRQKSRKFTHIAENPHVAIVISNKNEVKTLQIEGIATEETDPIKTAKMIDRLITITREQESLWKRWFPPIKQMREDGYLSIIRVEPTWMRWGNFSHSDDGVDNYFTQIIPTEAEENE